MIWIISGTQDGRELGAELADRENLKNPDERKDPYDGRKPVWQSFGRTYRN